MEDEQDQNQVDGPRPAVGDRPQFDYDRFSALAGELTEPPTADGYRVRFKPLDGRRPVRTRLLVVLALLFVGGFLTWLMLPSHWPQENGSQLLYVASLVMVANTGVIGLFALINVTALCRASLAARDPIPVSPQRGTRVAFLTTIVPSREPLSVVRATLEAALAIRHEGTLDVWLLDEGGDPAVPAMCAEIGVHHFSRAGIEAYNQPSGAFKTKSKHGNYNSWLDAHGDDYEFLVSVDPDHVPFPSFCERLLGYFRDPDVAFVVGPQVYGNYSRFVTRAAESQQFLFHSLLQRAGNRSRTPMLVGTNNAIRISALRAIGGLHDSITEDMATSLAFHSASNPASGRRWTSVYTPDLVAVGEGPETFTDYFTQQWRWSRGTNDVVRSNFWRRAHCLSPRQIVHYGLLLSYYPTTAIAWALGIFNGLLFMTLHVGGVTVPIHLWLMLYLDAAALQVGLYFWNRRHNVSPHERQGSSGVSGMFISALSTPVYMSSLVGSIARRKGSFVVTSKGDSKQLDTIATFATHLRWAAVIAVPMCVSLLLSPENWWMYLWSLLALLVCLVPVAIWRLEADRPSSGHRAPTRKRVVEPRRIAADPQSALSQGAEAA
jgi:cellulose synthase/poly-beta-1,6-N-acetylglucosamine synthase-like glycosyltransferase